MTDNIQDKPLGLWMTTSLVVGNMIGSGIFLLPAVLAVFGGISILGWLLTTLGSLAFALVFARLSSIYPQTGGLYVYCREELGETIGFLLAWTYWLSLCVGTAAISISLTSYTSYFVPSLAQQPIYSALFSLAILWILTLINANSVFSGGIMQLVTTIVKIVPLAAISIFGLLNFNLDNFIPFNQSNLGNINAILTTSAITLWAFLGLECASIPAGNIKNPEKTIPRATILGTVIASIVYIGSTIALMSIINPQKLQNSAAPFTDAAFILWGDIGSLIIGICAIVACLGAVNGWILVQGQISFAIANDGLLPKIFTKTSRHNAPCASIIISSCISTLIILLSYSSSLIAMFRLTFELSTIATLISFLFCAVSLIITMRSTNNKINIGKSSKRKNIIISWCAFVYGMFAVASSAHTTVYYCMILLLIGLPVYGYIKSKTLDGQQSAHR